MYGLSSPLSRWSVAAGCLVGGAAGRGLLRRLVRLRCRMILR
ncbi:MAG: hypothetical protein ACRDYX_07335 [Egibacteraceae bacterium]